jgi:hypothetical protein
VTIKAQIMFRMMTPLMRWKTCEPWGGGREGGKEGMRQGRRGGVSVWHVVYWYLRGGGEGGGREGGMQGRESQ